MKRRRFLSSLARSAAALTLSASGAGQTTDQAGQRHQVASGTALPAKDGIPQALYGATALEEYFSDERLFDALGTRDLQRPTDVKVVAFNFPSWHPSPWMEARFGKGWTEFDTLRDARALFPGHSMPHYPLWGYYDEADPEWAAREIELAAGHGVDAWMIDWYWHEGTQFYQEQLEQGLLRAPNRSKIQFAVMWANHDWKNVYPARSPEQAAIMLPQIHTVPDFERVANYCAEHYFSQPNYLRVGGAPLFAIFDIGKIVQQLGADGAKRGLDVLRERAARMGHAQLHLQIVGGYDHYEARLKEFGFDSATQYGTFGWTYGVKPPGSRLPYGVGVREGIASWKERRGSLSVPFHPCVSVGWDDSPRFGEYAAVAVDRSPDQFERFMRAARHDAAADGENKMIYVAAWNEWTEDHVLLPDTLWGYSYLEALRRGAGKML